MADKPFVVNDRRKFNADGDPRPDAPPSEPRPPREQPAPVESSASHAQPKGPQAVPDLKPAAEADREDLPPPPTIEQNEQAVRAYDATVDRLDTAIRAANPGMERVPDMSFERLIQSVYMQTIIQLGGGAEPGQQPQVDLLGARQSIDMLGVLAEKSKGNLTPAEDRLLSSALFEARMGFLEVTQLLSRQAAAKPTGPQATAPNGPSIVR
ncbi:MAG: DUF1844 domain-containing protein [Acidobacteriaceae bacterium]